MFYRQRSRRRQGQRRQYLVRKEEMVYTVYTKQRIFFLYGKGLKAPTIARILREEEKLPVTRVGIQEFLRRFNESGCLMRRPRSGRPSKLTMEIKQLVEAQMRLDDKTTAIQLHALLQTKGYNVSLRTILCCRSALVWTFRGSAYCQLIREVNMEKRLEWALKYKDDDFDDVIFTDECTVQMESHRRFCCRKQGETPRPNPRPKHPFKVHVWAGISLKGRTGICLFTGIMDRFLYIEILRKTLLPFITNVYSDGHCFMADNDPKHNSVAAQDFLVESNVNWWCTPAESSDLNPMENLWHELKEYIRREVKPRRQEELVNGIKEFWETVDVPKCQKYIGHLRKVIPKVIELKGAATGY